MPRNFKRAVSRKLSKLKPVIRKNLKQFARKEFNQAKASAKPLTKALVRKMKNMDKKINN